MNCTDFEREQIERIGDRTARLSDAAREHLAGCAGCRRAWQVDSALDPLIAAWRNAVLLSPSRDRLLAAVLADRPQATGRLPQQSSATLWSVLVALSVLCGLGIGLWQTGATNAPLIAARGPTAPAPTDLPITDSVASLWDGVQSRSQQAALETVKRLEEWPQVAIQEALPNPVVTEADHAPSPAADPRPWLEWSQPLGRQVGQAFRFLGEALPDPHAG